MLSNKKQNIVIGLFYVVIGMILLLATIYGFHLVVLSELETLIVIRGEIEIPPIEEIGVEAQIRRVFGSKDAPIALAVSQSENGSRRCDRIGVSGDIGVFQINPWIHSDKATPEELKDCLTNIRVAKQIFDSSGWFAWVDFNNGNYLAYMK